MHVVESCKLYAPDTGGSLDVEYVCESIGAADITMIVCDCMNPRYSTIGMPEDVMFGIENVCNYNIASLLPGLLDDVGKELHAACRSLVHKKNHRVPASELQHLVQEFLVARLCDRGLTEEHVSYMKLCGYRMTKTREVYCVPLGDRDIMCTPPEKQLFRPKGEKPPLRNLRVDHRAFSYGAFQLVALFCKHNFNA